jgi:hypothetical protein
MLVPLRAHGVSQDLLTWLPAVSCSGEPLHDAVERLDDSPLQHATGEFDSPPHFATERFYSLLYLAVGRFLQKYLT